MDSGLAIPGEVTSVSLSLSLLTCKMGAIPAPQVCCEVSVKVPSIQALTMNLANQHSCIC